MRTSIFLKMALLVSTIPVSVSSFAEDSTLPKCSDDLVPVSRSAPRWPRHDPMGTIEGQATYEFKVDVDGRLSKFVLVSAESASVSNRYAKAFAREARRALKKWRYESVTNACIATQTIEFRRKQPDET